jgi:membrane dipeptidase
MIFDAHADSLLRAMIEGYDLAERSPGHADLVRWKEGGVGAQVLAIWVDTIYVPHHAARRALQQIDAFYSLAERCPDRIALARTAEDVRRIAGGGRLAALLALEGGAAIQDDLALLRCFHRLGVTSMTLTHSASTGWDGLNDFGREIIREMNRLGMVVDVSHVSDATVADVLAVTDAPIIASHSCCRALCDHPRNLSDALLRDIAGSGGVIGINFYPGFLDPVCLRAMEEEVGDLLRLLNQPTDVPPERLDRVAAQRHRGFQAMAMPACPLERLFEHIDHAVAVVGAAHVGLGSDFDGINATPEGLSGADDLPRIRAGLLARGYGVEDVERILGGNFLRVLEEVQLRAA